ncbi:hypothetical protein AB0E56_11190 [Microbacterium sp. NPDC028030]|uniref:hypothetical protein n=1 Tax=Microbacterium sp. NPDC028030 TaxID=3155124 RepID=UPI00340985C5
MEAALDAARASRAASVALAEMARELILASSVPMGPTRVIREVLRQVVEAIEAMDLERQRDALQQLLTVHVEPGRGAERIKVWHLVATHLGPDAEDWTLADEGNSSGPRRKRDVVESA